MFKTLQTKPILGTGIYTIPDMSAILGISYPKVLRWINSFWNDKFGKEYGNKYSWNIDLTKAVNFYTMIELYTFYQLNLSGVYTGEIIKAHEILSKQFKTPYPFATKFILDNIKSDGKKVLFEQNDGSIYTVDVTKQFNLSFIKEFYKNLDFDGNALAKRFWPLGKDRSIVCDPHHKFGQPVIAGTNIQAEVLAEMCKAGDSIKFIARTYELSINQVKDAIEYAKKAA
ncbi:MAG: DUF433 domain-containing protein [Bacteroidota bacterium]